MKRLSNPVVLVALVALVIMIGATLVSIFVKPAEPTVETTATAYDDICEAATSAEEPANRQFTQAEDILQAGVDYQAVFCTDAGTIAIDLYENLAPLTVNNFVFLANNGYYNNTTFHRVIEDFMAQGGDPTGTGSGGPGYQFRDELTAFMTFDRHGLLAMANAGAGTNGSQFFITTVPTPHLDFQHTIFGEVLDGYDNVTRILLRDPAQPDSPATTLQTVVIVTEPRATGAIVEPVTADVIIEGLSAVSSPEQLPPDLVEGFEAPSVVAEADVPQVLADNGHEYHVTVGVTNSECNPDYFFEKLRYTVDLFDSVETVTNLLTGEDLTTINAEDGYTLFDTAYGIHFYRMDTSTDCSEEAVTVRVHNQRGHYLVTTEVTISQAAFDELGRDRMIGLAVNSIPQIFEGELAAVFRVPAPTEPEAEATQQ